MEISLTPKIEQHRKQQYENQESKTVPKSVLANPAFTGAADTLIAVPSTFLRFLDTNQAWGANLVDLASMVIPRTCYDMKNRGVATGLETARRESTGTFNHSMVGVYGTVLGSALAMGINRAYGFRAHKIFANNETLNILGNQWYKSLKSGSTEPLDDYLTKVISNIKVYNPSHENAVENLVSIGENTQKQVVVKLKDLIRKGPNETISKSDTNYLRALITASTGGEKKVVLNGFFKGKPVAADNTLTTLIENIHNVTKAFSKEKVVKSFKDAAEFDSVKILKLLKQLNVSRSAAGLGFAAMFGMSVQPINMYLTKKKTGCDGFPGVPGRKKDNSPGFKIAKTAMAALFATGAISTIMIGEKKSAVKELNKVLPRSEQLKEFGKKFLAKIQFKGMMPTINQLKFVYGMTIASRLMCARDTNELRESAVKDSLGFLNLLILGSLVTKGVTRLMSKDLINLSKNTGKGFINWMRNSSVKSRDEILLSTLNKHGVPVVENGKALSYNKLLQLVKGLPEDAKSGLKKHLAVLNAAQLAGYAYAGIFLGYCLPMINAKMSNANEERRIAKVAKAEGKTVAQVKAEMAEELKRMNEEAARKSGKKPAIKISATTHAGYGSKLIFNDVNSFKQNNLST